MGYNIDKIRIGTEQSRPEEGYNRQLYKETNFKNSSYGGFRVGGRYSTSASSIAFNTSQGYIYTTGGHATCDLGPVMSDKDFFSDVKAIKVVFDGMYQPLNSNTYRSEVGVLGFRMESKQNSFTLGMGTYTLKQGAAVTYNTLYSGYSLWERDDDGKVTTYFDNGTVYECVHNHLTAEALLGTGTDGLFYPVPNRGYHALGHLLRDNGSAGYLKDIHVYIAK